MIVGLGLDLVNVERIRRALAGTVGRLEAKVYSPGELENGARHPDPAAFLAGCFAAKEAFLKALGVGVLSGIALRDIEVIHEPGSPPRLAPGGAAAALVRQREIKTIHLTLTCRFPLAAAVVILES